MIKKKRWRLCKGDQEKENILIRELGVNPIVAKLMVNRHIDVDEGRQFLQGTLSDLLDPFTLKDMDVAVSLVLETIESHKPIVIYGDYDVDGITATSVLYRFLKKLGADVTYYIPERQSEGYGLNLEALEHLIERGTALVITVDCGISSYDIVEAVRDRIDMIITDHHTAPDMIPRAKAVINHKQKDCPYKDVAGLHERTITSGHIGFTLAPRLNAAGRVTHATRAVELLVTDDEDIVEAIAAELNETNRERQELERNIHELARVDVANQGHKADYVTIVAGEEWHPGVIGIVASRLVEEFYKPTLVISIHDGVGKGSCRSIDGFNIYDALKSCEDILLQFGGHAAAAGFSIDANRIDELRERLTKYCKAVITEEEYIPVVAIDAELPVDDIDVDIIDRVSDLEPYGMANSTPVFAIMEATVQDIMLMGQLKNHCKVIFATSNGTLDAIAWNRPDLFKSIFVGTVVKVAFSLQKNEWQGLVSPQLMIQAIEPLTEEPIKLSTEGLRQMYVIIKQSMRGRSQSVYNVEQDILRRKPADQNNRSALTSIDVFKELGIVEEYTSDDGQLMLRWNAIEGKLDLVTSVTFLTYSV